MTLFDDVLPRMEGKIRLLHGIPKGPAVDVYINGRVLYKNLSFGNITEYIWIPVGKYEVQLFKTNDNKNALVTEYYEVKMNSASTIAITFANSEISFFSLDDSEKDNKPLLSSVRFINLSPDSQRLSLRLPENLVLFNNVEYLETNEYYPLSPGLYNFIVVNSNDTFQKYISSIKLEKGLYITIYIIGLFNGMPQAGYVLVKD